MVRLLKGSDGTRVRSIQAPQLVASEGVIGPGAHKQVDAAIAIQHRLACIVIACRRAKDLLAVLVHGHLVCGEEVLLVVPVIRAAAVPWVVDEVVPVLDPFVLGADHCPSFADAEDCRLGKSCIWQGRADVEGQGAVIILGE